ncbi:MAG: hypothetical protein CME68_11340 [Halobacteriovoraceae bacterium]|nr:hypothetical protein [Halobacteriovoraceae bacterium]|tara:strand:- start:131 stop:1069 length:939 start_codon:yes stop_codon:yes gene_type:complete
MRFILLCLLLVPSFVQSETYKGSQFSKVWKAIKSDRYKGDLPHKKVRALDFGFLAKHIIKDSKRVVTDKSDFKKDFKKRIHANGVCLKGTWNITKSTKFTGLFKKGTEALIIARASVSLSTVTNLSKDVRFLGMAGKVYPTKNEKSMKYLKTANFLLIEDFGGSRTQSFLEATLSNNPKQTIHKELRTLAKGPVALSLKVAFDKADKNGDIRQLYQFSEMGLSDAKKAITPKYLELKGRKRDVKRIPDFRHELNIENYRNGIHYDIFITNDDKKKKWLKVGYIHFDDSVASRSCDRRLHFYHPIWREDVNHG